MIKKTRLLAGLAMGCVLSTPAAFAEEYKGFYFSLWGGGGSVDMAAKDDIDEVVVADLPADLDAAARALNSNDPLRRVTFDLDSIGDSKVDDTVSVWGVQVGYRWGKYFATELGYANLGEASYRLPIAVDFTDTTLAGTNSGTLLGERATKFTSAGPTIAALGMLPIGQRFDLHLRGGIYLADTRLTNRIEDVESATNLAHRRVDASETELLAGIGGAWNINERVSVRVEYQRFFDVGNDEKTGESDIDVYNLSVLFK